MDDILNSQDPFADLDENMEDDEELDRNEVVLEDNYLAVYD